MSRFAYATLLMCPVLGCADTSAPVRPEPYNFTLPANTETPLIFRWPSASLPVRVWAHSIGDFPEIVRDGLSAWRSASLYGEFQGILVADSNQADVIIRIEVGGEPYEVNQLACVESARWFVAHDTTLGLPFRAFVLARPGASSAEFNACVPAMVLHQLGHALGLFRHSPDSTDVMFDNPRATQLSARDRATFATLYHTRPNVGLPKVTLTADSSTGRAPFPTVLSANISDSATTALTYAFWWNCTDPGSDYETAVAVCGNPSDAAVGMRFEGVFDDPMTVTHQYPAAGEFTAKVIVNRAIPRPMEHRLAITVTAR